MKKHLKKILAAIMVVPAIFLFAGCGELKTPTEAVQSISSSATSVQTNAGNVADTNSPSMPTSQLSIIEDMSTLSSKLAEKGGELSSATLTLSGSLATLGVKIASFTVKANNFYEVAATVEMSEEDFNSLKQYAEDLKEISKDVETFANRVASKSTELANKLTAVYDKVVAGTFAISDLNAFEGVFDDVIEIVEDANAEVVKVNDKLQGVVSILDNYLAE